MIKNILEYLEASAGRYPDKTAFADQERSCTFEELLKREPGGLLHIDHRAAQPLSCVHDSLSVYALGQPRLIGRHPGISVLLPAVRCLF